MINEKLENLLLSLTKPQLLEVMLSAVDVMQSANHQSIQLAVMKAVDAEIDDRDDGVYYKLPSKAKLKADLS